MYPIFLHLKGKRCLVIGAGYVAQRRVQALLEQGAHITVVAPDSMPEVWHNKNIQYIQSCYTKSLIKRDYTLIFAATDDPQKNDQIVLDAQNINVLVCSVTEGAHTTDFLVPAVRQVGNISFAVSTGGSTPALTAAICKIWEKEAKDYANICPYLELLRNRWKNKIVDSSTRYELLRNMVSKPAIHCMRQGGIQRYITYAERMERRMYTETSPVKKAIVVVSFGTSYEDTLQKTIGAVETAIQTTFPEYKVVRAFTSNMILQKMQRRGIHIDNVCAALDILFKDGYTHIYCQPTHLIPGDEYEKLCKDAEPYKEQFELLKIGTPLLTMSADFLALQKAMTCMVEKSSCTAYVLMGHGTTHQANLVYPAFDNYWKYNGYDNVFVCTVEGYPTIETILAMMHKGNYEKVVLLPMMLVAGDHVHNDMAGDTPDSWKSIFQQHGYMVEVRAKGLGEYETIQALYVNHVQSMLDMP